jgi:hypothetical protein
MHVVDGKERYTEVLNVMARTVRCGWYRQATVVKKEGVERIVKAWISLRDGRSVEVGEWEGPPSEE